MLVFYYIMSWLLHYEFLLHVFITLWALITLWVATHPANFVDEEWSNYLLNMQQMNTYGDHLAVQRASTMFNIQFVIVSTLGVDATSIISPCGQYDSLPLLVLGHFAEGHGDHYVSLDGPVTHLIQRAHLFDLSRLRARVRAEQGRR